jgi:hypothetical protein
MPTLAAMSRHRSWLLALAVLCAWWAVPPAAHAEDPDALIKHGVELRRAGRDQEALEQFRRANELAPSPRALAQIGLAEQALGRWPEAEDHVTQALASAQDAWIAKNRATLEKSLADIGEHLGSLDVLGDPPGAEVLVQGRVAGKLPLTRPLRVTAGSVALEVRAADYLPVTRTVTVAAGQLTRESVALPPTPRPGGAGAQGQPDQTPRGAPPPPPREPVAEARPLTKSLAWVALLAGSASAAVGVTSLIVREVDARNFNTNCANPKMALTMSQQSQCSDWQSGGSTASGVAVATFIAAGALGAASAALFYVSRSPRQTETATALACAPTVATLGLSCAARF